MEKQEGLPKVLGRSRPDRSQPARVDPGLSEPGKPRYRGSRRDDVSSGQRSARPELDGRGQRGRDANGYRRTDAGAGPRRTDSRAERRGSASRDQGGRVVNPQDLRRANRPDRERSPEIAEGVTGAELDGSIRAQLRTLETRNGEWVAKHLVMAGRLIDEEPELAFQHALAASRRGGRLAAVREAVGLTAYAAGRYDEALRELRTFRRISGSHVHLPLMADSERGLGRPDRALELAHSDDAAHLDPAGRVELAIVAAGARGDQGQWQAAEAELRLPQLDRNRAFSFSPRLFRAYADVLERLGQSAEAVSWRRQAALAEQLLGFGEEEPEILDVLDDQPEPLTQKLVLREDLARPPRARQAET